jgi:hypothetical protein
MTDREDLHDVSTLDYAPYIPEHRHNCRCPECEGDPEHEALMTSADTPTTDQPQMPCSYCGASSIAQSGPYAWCFTCLYGCRDCGTFLPLNQDTRYCDDCGEARTFAAWDKTQP